MSTPPAEVRLTYATIAFLKEEIKVAVREGITGAMNEETAEAFWAAGFKVLQEQAAKHTGRFVLGGLVGLARKVVVFVFLGWIVYMVGGWALLAKFWHALFGG